MTTGDSNAPSPTDSTGNDPISTDQVVEDVEVSRYRKPRAFWTNLILALTLLAIAIAINELFQIGAIKMVIGNKLVQNQYIYLLVGVMVSMIFSYRALVAGDKLRSSTEQQMA